MIYIYIHIYIYMIVYVYISLRHRHAFYSTTRVCDLMDVPSQQLSIQNFPLGHHQDGIEEIKDGETKTSQRPLVSTNHFVTWLLTHHLDMYMYVSLYINHICRCMCMCIYACMYIYIYMYIHILCTYLFIFIYIYIYIYV